MSVNAGADFLNGFRLQWQEGYRMVVSAWSQLDWKKYNYSNVTQTLEQFGGDLKFLKMIQNQFKYNLCEWSCGSRDDLSQTLSQCLKIMEKVKVETTTDYILCSLLIIM